ncbi:MAG: hypothetical protein GX996_03045 [Firmicutes bacterium]|nr:hypothetical protein [Bacillota bacterium]
MTIIRILVHLFIIHGFTWLKGRGLRGVEMITSDNHGGLVKTIRRHFRGVSWQRC